MLSGNQSLCCSLILELSAVLTARELGTSFYRCELGGTRVLLVPESTLIRLARFVDASIVAFADRAIDSEKSLL